LAVYLIGTLKGAREFTRPKSVRVVQQPLEQISVVKNTTSATGAITTTVGSVGGIALLAFLHKRGYLSFSDFKTQLLRLVPNFAHASLEVVPKINLRDGGFSQGFISAGGLFTTIGVIIGTKLSSLTQIQSGFTRYPPHRQGKRMAKANPHLAKGFLDPKEYQELPLSVKEKLSPNVYRFVFTLPRPKDIIGLPIGQHVAIKATIDGQSVSRSYTPTSNNMDSGLLELVIKCYSDGLLTGRYLENLEVGDKVLFRGPKGAMKYKNGLCRRIGMIAGGTGITPMYQLIRAICEDETDTTEISLVYANRSEEDILLRDELEKFARRYPKNLKLWYMLDHPPQNWKYGKGYVTREIMCDRLPAPSSETKIMLCGPPGMVNASKKALSSLGFEAPGTVPKMTDQIFCF
jgi:cytochrome-b5 reductase